MGLLEADQVYCELGKYTGRRGMMDRGTKCSLNLFKLGRDLVLCVPRHPRHPGPDSDYIIRYVLCTSVEEKGLLSLLRLSDDG